MKGGGYGTDGTPFLPGTITDVTAAKPSRPSTSRLSLSVSFLLICLYSIIFSPHFVVFHISFYISFGKMPNLFWERPHFCQEAVSQSREQVCFRSPEAEGVLYNMEEPGSHSCCMQSAAPAVRLSAHLSGLKTKELSHRDVWQRMLSHSTAREVFIRLFFLNWKKGQPFV